MHIVLTGGGSAGHVTPHLALLPYFREKDCKVEYIGSKTGIEKEIIAEAGLPYHGISSGKLRRYFSLKNFSDPFRILGGYFEAKKILRKSKPDVLFSKGGYVSVPVVFAAHSLGIPVVMHESDYTPGLANRLCLPKAEKICFSFEAAAADVPAEKAVVTGAPGPRQPAFRFPQRRPGASGFFRAETGAAGHGRQPGRSLRQYCIG